jgi:hypothetical protein
MLVTGANGGVGSVAIALLAKLGYRVVASTGRLQEADFLKALGAAEVIDRAELSAPGKPLAKERWAGVVDTVGSHTLANACAATRYGGAVAACGLAQGMDFPASVAPFILRGVTLYGIDSVMAPMAVRAAAWARLARDLWTWPSCQWLDWREQWFAFTALGCLFLIPALGWLPPPDTSGLTSTGQKMQDRPPSPLYLRIFMAAYFCAGIGYVVSATFIVAIVNKLPGLAGQGNLVFLAIGLGAAPACINWDFIARRTGDLNALILAAILQIVGILLPVLIGGLTAALFGALLFGGTFIGMVSLVLTMAGRYYPTRPAKMMGKMTLSYGAAQILGPAVTGTLATHFGSYNAGLYFAAAVMAIGTVLLLVLKVVERRDAMRLAV